MELALRLAHLYPGLMNIYGDRGNIMCLRRRCQARGISLEVVGLGLRDPLAFHQYDIIFMGGGQDREQRRVAEDLARIKGGTLRQEIEEGTVTLAVCGGYQLFGHYYRTAIGEELPGVGIFDAWTVHPGPSARRCIGNVVATWEDSTLVGFENHGGRTYLGPNAQPLAQVVVGFGNNGEDGTEGAIYKNAIGTYLHGSLLPKNSALADRIIALALKRKYGIEELAPLDDSIEQQAHAAAIRVATSRPSR